MPNPTGWRDDSPAERALPVLSGDQESSPNTSMAAPSPWSSSPLLTSAGTVLAWYKDTGKRHLKKVQSQTSRWLHGFVQHPLYKGLHFPLHCCKGSSLILKLLVKCTGTFHSTRSRDSLPRYCLSYHAQGSIPSLQTKNNSSLQISTICWTQCLITKFCAHLSSEFQAYTPDKFTLVISHIHHLWIATCFCEPVLVFHGDRHSPWLEHSVYAGSLEGLTQPSVLSSTKVPASRCSITKHYNPPSPLGGTHLLIENLTLLLKTPAPPTWARQIPNLSCYLRTFLS